MVEKEIRFTPKDRDLIMDETFAGPDVTDRLKIAEMKGKHLVAKYDYYDLEELLGFIYAAANHAEDKKLQNQLDRLSERLQKVLDTLALLDD